MITIITLASVFVSGTLMGCAATLFGGRLARSTQK